MPPTIAVEETDIRLLNLETRLPFEFGIATMTKLPHCFVRLDCTIDGQRASGIAADHFPPKWFTKDPELSLHEEVEAMLEVVQRACEHATAVTGESVFECWVDIVEAQEAWAADTDYPPLLWHFGVTFVERALIDAFCKATDRTFADAVRSGKLGTRPEYVYDELSGTNPADVLPDDPARSVAVRHTVGHDDPLTDPGADAPNDGLPVTLEANIEAYGLDRFKIKIAGDIADDHDRLRAVLDVLDWADREYAFTLDANEQYQSVADLAALFDRIRDDDGIDAFDERLLFVEQPFPREIALSERIGDELAAWDDAPPIIIDESDGPLDSLGTALERGYAGTSHKNCKGVFKGIINACLIETRRGEDTGREYVLSAEDLTTIGPVSLLEDLAVVATLGISHVERNGHHYFRGLSMVPEPVQSAVLDAHDDCYRRHENGFPTLDIRDGCVDIDSVVSAPFGYDLSLDVTQFDTPDEWTFTSPTQ